MRAKHWVGFLLVVLALSACGDDTGTVSTHKGKPGGDTAGRSGGTRDAGFSFDAGMKDHPDADVPDGGGGDGGMSMTPLMPGAPDPRAPLVEIVDPVAAKTPNDGNILTVPTVTVKCDVNMSDAVGARLVKESSVRIFRPNLKEPTKPILGTVRSVGPGQFAADFDLSAVPNGELEFLCSATDVGKPALTGVATVSTFIDLGPTIEIVEPIDGSSHQLASPVPIKFRVSSWPVALDDTQAAVTNISLTVSGQSFDFMEDPQEKGLYVQNVDFSDTVRYPMPPTTAEFVIKASSSRSPSPVERRVASNITIDADGPKIVIKAPLDQDIVRGDVKVQVEITDPSGVDTGSVDAVIELGDDSYTLTDWDISGATYSDHFDTNGFDQTKTQMTINVHATDAVGNKAEPVSVLVRLDNVPPILSLDPPFIREFITNNVGQHVCSETFDPVGDDSTNDLQKVQVESTYRVMMWDRTNQAPGQVVFYVAGIDDTTAQLYTQPDPGTPLLVDRDGDVNHICDELDLDPLLPSPAVALKLVKIKPNGQAFYQPSNTFTDPRNTPDPSFGCVAGNRKLPDPLCASTQMFRAITQPLDQKSPPGAIFAPGATSEAFGACNGITWDLNAIDGEGWHCMAARVQDTIGNVGISRPLRVCIDNEDPSDGTPDCDPGLGDQLKCTDGCVWPDAFPQNMVLLER